MKGFDVTIMYRHGKWWKQFTIDFPCNSIYIVRLTVNRVSDVRSIKHH